MSAQSVLLLPSSHLDSLGTQLLDRAFAPDGLFAVFQPLARLDNLDIVAHEGLTRPAFALPGVTVLDVLRLAEEQGRLAEFELHAVRRICETFADSHCKGRLLINFSVHTLLKGGLRAEKVIAALSTSTLDLGRITIEITERDTADNPKELLKPLGYLRARGVRIALDDFGSGHSNFQMWNEIHPEVVKIDRYLINGLARSAERLAIVRSLCRVAETLGTDLVGEGVEDVADLRMLHELGIAYAQGFLLGKPLPLPVTLVAEEAREGLRDRTLSVPPRPRGPSGHRRICAGHLVSKEPAFTVENTNDDILALFATRPNLHAVAVVRDQRPIGLINRRLFTERLAQPFTRELFGRKSCMTFMQNDPLLCDEKQTLEGMADILRGEDQSYLADGIIVTREGRYLGLATGESLVRRVTEHRIEAARHANPLTFLPGNIPVTEHLTRLLRNKRHFVAAYVDLTDFKPFNDQYGYFRGDEMIRLLAGILTANTDPAQDFVGHIGGDDFLLLLQSSQWQSLCLRIIETFNERARVLFDDDDLARGGIEGDDRRGVRQFFPLTTVTIGAVCITPPFSRRPEVIAMLAARAKRHAKRGGLGLHAIGHADSGGESASNKIDRLGV